MLDIKRLNELIEQKYINVQKHPTLPLRILNYSPKCQFDKMWNEITLMCRGLVIDAKYNIIARPFEKFFNYEEVLDKIPNEEFEAFEKMDGSMIQIFYYKGEIVVSSRGSFTSEQAIWATELLNNKYSTFKEKMLPNYNYICELIKPENRIVVNYGQEEKLILLAVINKHRVEIPYDDIKNTNLPIPLVEKYDGLKDFKQIQALNIENKEGFVIRFKSGFRMKIKFEDYCRLHRIVTGVSSRTIWEYLKEGKSLDELITNVPDEFFDFVKQISRSLQSEFNMQRNIVEMSYNRVISELPKTFTQKEFAEKVFSHTDINTYRGLLFSRHGNKDLTAAIWKMIKPNFCFFI